MPRSVFFAFFLVFVPLKFDWWLNYVRLIKVSTGKGSWKFLAISLCEEGCANVCYWYHLKDGNWEAEF